MLKKRNLSLAILSTLSISGIVHAQDLNNYTQTSNYSEQAIYGGTSSSRNVASTNSSTSTATLQNVQQITSEPVTPSYSEQAIYGTSTNNTPVFGTTSSSSTNNNSIYGNQTISNSNVDIDPTAGMDTSDWVKSPENKGTPNGFNVDNTPKSQFVDQQTAMDNWTFSKLHCNLITQNLHFKGLADYLPLWNPPVDSIDDTAYTKIPLFAMTDLIYNDINYGKGAVLLGSATIMNSSTGNINSQMSNAPVTINNCNITWVIPDEVIANLEAKSKQSSSEGGYSGFTAEAVQKLNADAQARQANATANGIKVPYKVYNSTGFKIIN